MSLVIAISTQASGMVDCDFGLVLLAIRYGTST